MPRSIASQPPWAKAPQTRLTGRAARRCFRRRGVGKRTRRSREEKAPYESGLTSAHSPLDPRIRLSYAPSAGSAIHDRPPLDTSWTQTPRNRPNWTETKRNPNDRNVVFAKGNETNRTNPKGRKTTANPLSPVRIRAAPLGRSGIDAGLSAFQLNLREPFLRLWPHSWPYAGRLSRRSGPSRVFNECP